MIRKIQTHQSDDLADHKEAIKDEIIFIFDLYNRYNTQDDSDEGHQGRDSAQDCNLRETYYVSSPPSEAGLGKGRSSLF